MRNRGILYFLTACLAASMVAAILVSDSSAAGNTQLVYSFTGGSDGGNAATRLVFDTAGNAYGTTVVGGTFGCGTVFKLHPSRGTFLESVLWNFSCFGDGKNPHGGVTLDSAGNIYGTTVAGGSGGICTGDGCGVVFRLQSNGLVILHDFTGGSDGFGPGGPAVLDAAGNVFGETPDGGASGKGTVFELVRHGTIWQHKILHNFSGGADGSTGSLGPLLFDTHGNLFGVTEVGGAHSAGNVFELSPGAGGTFIFKVIYDFKGQPDAAFAYGGLIPDASGNLYGTTYFGGTSGNGAVYELSPHGSGWSERVLYSFKGGTDGSLPTSTLVFDDNNLYGTTTTGGRPSCDCGTIFKLNHISGAESVVHNFGVRPDGSYPYYTLTRGSRGNFFSSTVAGGLYGQGTIFMFTP